MNQTLLDKVCTMLIDASLPETYWYDTLRYAVHIHNVTPTRALIDMTPEEAWSRNKPDISNLQIFGLQAFIHIPILQCNKLSVYSLICIFIGFACQCKAYRLVHRQKHRFIESCDIIFNKGGTSPCTERITFKNNVADSQLPQLPPQLQPDTTQPMQPVPPPQITTATTNPSAVMTTIPGVAATRPKCVVCTPVCDNDMHYSVSSYGSRACSAEHANVARTDMS